MINYFSEMLLNIIGKGYGESAYMCYEISDIFAYFLVVL